MREVRPDEVDVYTTKSKLTFLDCWAPWCKPCRDLAPILAELDEKYADNDDITFLKIDVDEYKSFGRENDIRAIPCVLVFVDGKPGNIVDPSSPIGKKTDRLLGRRGHEDYKAVIKQVFG